MSTDEREEKAMQDLSWLAAGLAQEFGASRAVAMLLNTVRMTAEEHWGNADYVRVAIASRATPRLPRVSAGLLAAYANQENWLMNGNEEFALAY